MSQPIPMVHIREFTLQTLLGHSITFKGANDPVMVPAEAVQEAMASGAAPVSQADIPDNSGVQQTKREAAEAAPQGPERIALIKEAMRDMIGINNPDDFDANGQPRVPALNAKLSFKTDTAERNKLWPELKAEMKAE